MSQALLRLPRVTSSSTAQQSSKKASFSLSFSASMASLSPPLLPCTVQPNPNTALSSVHASRTLPPIRYLGLSPVLTGRNGTVRARQGRLVASAISGSPGTESKSKEESAYPIGNLEVFDLNGKAIPITDLWKDRTAVVAFARHFGCVLCRRRADFLAAKKDVMDAAGVALVLIGPGSVDQARTFYEQTKFQGEVYADPSYKSYQALQFVSGVTTTFTPKAALQIIQSYKEGYRQDWKLSFEKDTRTRGGWQQGGIIVAGPGKDNMFYIYRDKEAGDEPEIEDVLRACCSERKK